MGKKQLRGKAGNVAKYITRTRAVKRLQLRLAEFRRLCILKGIHPREPKKKVHGQNKTYYHLKDINFLAHEPLLESFRAISAHDRKVKKARARRNAELAKQLLTRAPTYRLDHLVRERYPTFQDALRDLDDGLCMVHLFAVLPTSEQHGIPTDALQMSRRLVLEWQALMCRMHALRKAFISVKGFYLQADIHTVNVTWLMPHATSQILPKDVDMRVMLTFLEFYHSLMRFVLYKLYHDMGLRYPPVVRPEKEEISAELADIIQELSGAQRSVEEQISAQKGSVVVKQVMPNSESPAESPAVEQNGSHPATAAHTTPADNPQVVGTPSPSGKKSSTKRRSKESVKAASDAGNDEEVIDKADDLDLLIDSGDEDNEDDVSDDDDELWSGDDDGVAEGGLTGDAGEGDEDMYEQAQLDQVLRMRLAEAEAASQGHRGMAEAGDGAASAIEERFGKEAVAAAGGAVATGGDTDDAVCGKLFSGMVFWLAREVPREVLMLIIRCFGGTAAWEGPGSPLPEDSDTITHHVVDRPHNTHQRMGRMYIQPQWLFDCANFRVAVAASDYAPGKRPPPHLSPFESYDEGDYIPEAAARLKRLQAAAAEVRRAPLEGSEMVGGVATGGDAENEEGSLIEAGEGADGSAQREAAAQELFENELVKEIGVTAKAALPVKRKVQEPSAGGNDDIMSDAQKKVFMSRKERKVFDSLRKAEDAKASKAETLRKKKVALAK